MKKNTHFSTTLFQAIFILATLIMTSCSDKQKSDDSAKVAASENNAKFDNKKLEKDAQFLVDATEINLEEIQLGQLAQEKSSNADVKELAKMMVTAHSNSLKSVTALAKKKLVTIPDSVNAAAQDAYTQLNGKSGSDFNKTYCTMLVDGHKKAIATFEKESTESRDMDIKDWSTAMLPDLRKHLDHVFACQKKCEKM